MKIAIRGVGVVGAFGSGTGDLLAALGGAPVIPEKVTVSGPGGKVVQPVFRADPEALCRYVPKRGLRRVDRISRMALLGAHLALEEAGGIADPSRTGVIVGTGYGAMATTFDFLGSVMDNGDVGASPIRFSNSVHNAPAAHLAVNLAITGPNLTVSQFEFSFLSAMITAISWLRSGRVDTVLLGAVDEYCDLLGYCHHRFFGCGEGVAGRILPFDLERQTALPGEGSFFFVLERGEEGAASSCGYIREVVYKRTAPAGTPCAADDGILFLGLDGMAKEASRYRARAARATHVAAYAPLCGSHPSGMAFDMAVAALCLREKKIYASPEVSGRPEEFPVHPGDIPLKGGDSIRCLKYAGDYEGEILLSPR